MLKSAVVYDLYGVYLQTSASILLDPRASLPDGSCVACRIGRRYLTPCGWHHNAEACMSCNTCYEMCFNELSASVCGDTDCSVLGLAPCSLVRGLTSMSDLENFSRPWRCGQYMPPKRVIYLQYHTVSRPRPQSEQSLPQESANCFLGVVDS